MKGFNFFESISYFLEANYVSYPSHRRKPMTTIPTYDQSFAKIYFPIRSIDQTFSNHVTGRKIFPDSIFESIDPLQRTCRKIRAEIWKWSQRLEQDFDLIGLTIDNFIRIREEGEIHRSFFLFFSRHDYYSWIFCSSRSFVHLSCSLPVIGR